MTSILKKPREGVDVNEGAGVATFCTIVDSLEEDDYPTERDIIYTISTEDGKITSYIAILVYDCKFSYQILQLMVLITWVLIIS